MILISYFLFDILEQTKQLNTHNFVVATCITDKTKIKRKKFIKVPFIELKTTPFVFTVEEPPKQAKKAAQDVI